MGDHHRSPIYNRAIESQSSGSGPVTTRRATPEELAQYQNMPNNQPRDSLGERINKPVQLGTNYSSEEQRRRAAKRYEERSKMDDSNQVRPTMEEFLRQRAMGHTISAIEMAMSLPKGSLSYWIGKWDLRGITPEKAKAMMEAETEKSVKLERIDAVKQEAVPEQVYVDGGKLEASDVRGVTAGYTGNNTTTKLSDVFSLSRRYVQSAVVGEAEQITDELAALINYIRSGNGIRYHLEVHLQEVPPVPSIASVTSQLEDFLVENRDMFTAVASSETPQSRWEQHIPCPAGAPATDYQPEKA